MISSTTKSFRDGLRALPPEIQRLARKKFRLWLRDPAPPSLRFKKVGLFWSARVGANHRALAKWRAIKSNGSEAARTTNTSKR